MTTIVAVTAGAVVLDFLSILEGSTGEPVTIHLTSSRLSLDLAANTTLDERLEVLAGHVSPSSATWSRRDGSHEWLATSLASRAPATVWTHSPADDRRAHRDAARDATRSLHGAPFQYAAGSTSFLQVSGEVVHPLRREAVAAKLRFVNEHCADLLGADDPETAVTTARVPATEVFHPATAEQVERAWALMSSLDDGAADVVDPWDLMTSAYEGARLDQTASWIASMLPRGALVVEPGACEGQLTRRLLELGLEVVASEPNPAFRERLRERVGGAAVVRSETLEQLATAGAPRADAYVLIEMLYYGQELDLLDSLPTDAVFVSASPERMRVVDTWLAGRRHWSCSRRTLTAPRLEEVSAGLAHLVKRGSRGALLNRVLTERGAAQEELETETTAVEGP